MKIKKNLIPKREERFKKKIKPFATNIDIMNPENMILSKIIQKDSSFKSLKEKIKKESNNNLHEILSSDESRLKAINYVMNASKGKENQKNNININQNKKNNLKVKKNLSFGAVNELPLPNYPKNKIKVKRNQKVITTKIETISPIKNKENKKDDYTIEDKRFKEDALLKEKNILVDKNIQTFFEESPLVLVPRNQSYEITSRREVNLQYIQKKDKIDYNNNNNNMYRVNNTQNNFYENKNIFLDENKVGIKTMFYHKIKNNKGNGRNRSILSDYNQPIFSTYDNAHNKTLNSFYIPKQIENLINENNKKNRKQ